LKGFRKSQNAGAGSARCECSEAQKDKRRCVLETGTGKLEEGDVGNSYEALGGPKESEFAQFVRKKKTRSKKIRYLMAHEWARYCEKKKREKVQRREK